MKIAVIAANGRSGRVFVAAALAAGHSVTAGVHNGSLPDEPGLRQIPCDANNRDDLARLVAGQDAVVSLIGHVKGSPPRLQTEAMKLLLPVMQAAGVQRLISLTGTGVRMPGDRITLIDRLLNAAVLLIDRQRIIDGREHVAVLQQSDIAWTVLRVLKLQTDMQHNFILTAHGPTLPYVSRHDVAQAIVDVLEAESFQQQAPMLSKP